MVAVGFLGLGAWHGTPRADCPTDSLVIDTTGAVRSVAALMGEGPGETFVTNDTLVSAITVWRRAEQADNISGMKLWITEVDSTGRPLYYRVVFEGPVLEVRFGDGVHPVQIRFGLDPPAVLPHRGKFAFSVQNQCDWFFDLLIRDGTVYPDGVLWRSEIANTTECLLKGVYDHFDEYDLACKIEFCHDVPTATTRRSWGSLKVLYR